MMVAAAPLDGDPHRNLERFPSEAPSVAWEATAHIGAATSVPSRACSCEEVGGGVLLGQSPAERRDTAVRAAKPRSVRNVSIALPDLTALPGTPVPALDPKLSARTTVEGAEVGEMDWDLYRSDRRDCDVASLTIIAHAPDAAVQSEGAR